MFRSIQGIGGVFIYANDAPAMRNWYSKVFGLVPDDPESEIFYVEYRYLNHKDPEVKESFSWAIIPAKEKLDTSSQRYFINYRVRNMDEFIRHLNEIGIECSEVKDFPEGRFTSITDPENNRLEIWEPSGKFMTWE
ncbi:MAG: VOC family protein [Ignavibacteria bacterium]|nr:VOC family protein [Ignavibacteria bacterium]